MYDEIKKNIINNFFNTYYLWSCVLTKNTVIGDIKNRCPFEVETNTDNDILTMNLGDNIIIDFNLTWEKKVNVNNIVVYKLVNIC
jgi:hypothetical protein